VRRKILISFVVLGLSVGPAAAQFPSSIVYDPTNYANAVLRYHQLEQHLVELEKTYTQITNQLNLAIEMAKFIENMPVRYRALFSQWRDVTAANTFGNTALWVSGINSGLVPTVNLGYEKATIPLGEYDPVELSAMDSTELDRVESGYASVELADGANTNAMAAIGSIRGNAAGVQAQMANLEQDSFSNDPSLNTEVSVLNKINAANVLTLRTAQDSNKLLASLLEQQTILAKQERDEATNAINTDIGREATMAANIAEVTRTITNSLQNFRMP
jgi:hypothetical protein